MTVIVAVIGSIGTSVWKPEHRVEIVSGGALVALLIIIGIRVQKHKNMRKLEERLLKDLNEMKSARGNAAQHLLNIVGRESFMWEFTHKYPDPETYRSPEVEEVLKKLNLICREESEGMIDAPDFLASFWDIVKGYWLTTHSLIISDQKTNPERWKYIFPVYDKYRKMTGFQPDHFADINFLEDEAKLT